jgi:hypothetical protein
MERDGDHNTNNYLAKIQEINQGILYIFNDASEKIPVCLVQDYEIEDQETLKLKLRSFPFLLNYHEVYGAELHCYKKDISFSVILYGIVILRDGMNMQLQFNIQRVDSFEKIQQEVPGSFSLFSFVAWPYKYVYQKSHDFFVNGFKKKDQSLQSA